VFIASVATMGYLISTVARNQMQAMQMTFFFFLPSMLLSGFMFPFRGMPHWAQAHRRGAAAHALPAHRARHHAEGRRIRRRRDTHRPAAAVPAAGSSNRAATLQTHPGFLIAGKPARAARAARGYERTSGTFTMGASRTHPFGNRLAIGRPVAVRIGPYAHPEDSVMSTPPPITVSSLDLERVERHLNGEAARRMPGIDALQAELDRATVVEPEEMRPISSR
jgi:hypothetical protein